MGTRCLINFAWPATTKREKPEVVATIYRHFDGYPDGVLPDLGTFFKDVMAQTYDTRFGDASYLASKYVVWQAVQNALGEAKWAKEGDKVGYLNFLSLGIVKTGEQDYGSEYHYLIIADGDRDKLPTVKWREAGTEAWKSDGVTEAITAASETVLLPAQVKMLSRGVTNG